MELREYQKQAIQNIREAFRNHKRVFFELPTGAGKTVIFTEIAKLLEAKGRSCWIVVPRDILKKQTSQKLLDIGVNHGIIAPGSQERSVFNVHVVSKDTWIRRQEKIINDPDFIIVDEGHLATGRYEEMILRNPNAYFLFVSATPERLDGKPLTRIAEKLIHGPSMRWLIENNYLSPMRYYCPPIKGLDQLHKRGHDFDANELEEFLNEKKIYGKSIEHYKRLCSGDTAIIFCRSIDAAKKTADRFSLSGFLFESIDGTMSEKKRSMLIDAVKQKKIHGLTSCDLVTYGLDVPNVSAIIMLRPTLSRALYYQMIGRGLRVMHNKQWCTILDHVGNARRHCIDGLPWDPIKWNFEGIKKRTRNMEKIPSLKFCPYIEFQPCLKLSCIGCEYNKENKPIKDFEEIDGELKEIVSNIKYKERPQEEQSYYYDEIKENKHVINGNSIDTKKLKKMLDIAVELRRSPLWVYHTVCDDWVHDTGQGPIVHFGLLEEIRKIKGYKRGWVYMTEKNIRENKKRAC